MLSVPSAGGGRTTLARLGSGSAASVRREDGNSFFKTHTSISHIRIFFKKKCSNIFNAHPYFPRFQNKKNLFLIQSIYCLWRSPDQVTEHVVVLVVVVVVIHGTTFQFRNLWVFERSL